MFRRARKQHGIPKRPRLRLEVLETRCLLHGSITLTGGVLEVMGDDTNNVIAVTLDSSQQIHVVMDGHEDNPAGFALSDVQSISIRGLAGNDDITVDDAAPDPITLPTDIRGGDGNDTVSGGAGADEIAGGSGNDVINGRGGNDEILGDSGGDILRGREGNDVVRGVEGNDLVLGGDGNDTLHGGDGDDTIDASNGDDQARGRNGADSIDGGPGNDLLFGRKDNDTVNGGADNDTLFADYDDENEARIGPAGTNTVNGDIGNDVVNGGDGSDSLNGGDGNDTLLGRGADDTVSGGIGNDSLRGLGGNDILRGDAGTDTLDGGIGDDMLDGGADNDNLQGFSGDDVMVGGAGTDTVTGGEGGDVFAADSGDVRDVNTAQGDADAGAAVTSGSETDPSLRGIRTDQQPGAPPVTAGHTADTAQVDYGAHSNPPTYGDHHSHGQVSSGHVTPSNAPVTPTGLRETEFEDEDLVHSLEHGHVWISYDPDRISAPDLERLRTLVGAYGPTHGVILTRRTLNDSAIAMASWIHLQKLATFNVTDVRDFIVTNRGHGPESFRTP